MKILALVKDKGFTQLLIDKKPVFDYDKFDDIIVGKSRDGLFYKCYQNEGYTPKRKAFAGGKFEIPLRSGKVERAYGQWWDGGYYLPMRMFEVQIIPIGYCTLEDGKKRLSFCAGRVDLARLRTMVNGMYRYTLKELEWAIERGDFDVKS